MKQSKKKAQNKAGWVIFFALVVVILCILLGNRLLEIGTLKAYSPDYFVCVKLPFSVFYIFYPIFFLFLFLVAIYFYPRRKLTNKNYIGISAAFLCVALALTIVFCGNVWSFNKDTITYNTLFQKDKAVYHFDDIDSAQLQTELVYTRSKTTNLEYRLKMRDGTEIHFDAYDSFRTDDDKIIAFDKAIAKKRTTVGQFEQVENASDAFNEYFRSLF